MAIPRISWDWGTAYDLFASLHVLHHPDRFGLRGAWAAGVRSRLPAAQRSVLESAQDLFGMPLCWIYNLPAPKDAATAIYILSQIPSAERLPALALNPDMPADTKDLLQEVAARRTWNDADLENLRIAYQQKAYPVSPKALVNVLEGWSRPDDFGECYLEALQAYQAVFFAEEERRIRPVLQHSLVQSQAHQPPTSEADFISLVDELSQGVNIAALADAADVVLAPSYWTTPLVAYARLGPERMLLLFGGRPAELALAPGELIPDAMLRTLKALADPTRLRILRYLSGEPLSPSQLSRRLRLRAPTMIHHLNMLRLAGVVHLSLDAQGEKRYTIRPQAVEDTFALLQKFLAAEEDKEL
jgi:DNA-binding transcriptional ArsR family regulator